MATQTVQQLLDMKPSRVLAIPADASLQDALEMMVRHTVSSLLVIENGKLVGIVSERDYIRKAVPKRLAPWDVTVGELMTREIISVSKIDPIRTCMELMCANRIRHLPVVEGETVVGVVSITDVLSALRPAAGAAGNEQEQTC